MAVATSPAPPALDEASGMALKELRSHLRDSLRATGVVGSLTAQLRHRVISGLRAGRADGAAAGGLGGVTLEAAVPRPGGGELSARLCLSVVADFLRVGGLSHSYSVFMPECGGEASLLARVRTLSTRVCLQSEPRLLPRILWSQPCVFDLALALSRAISHDLPHDLS